MSPYRRPCLRTSSTVTPSACAPVSFPSSSPSSPRTAVHCPGGSSNAAWFTPTPREKDRCPPSMAENAATAYPSADRATPGALLPRLRAAQESACSTSAVVLPSACTPPTRRLPPDSSAQSDRPAVRVDCGEDADRNKAVRGLVRLLAAEEIQEQRARPGPDHDVGQRR